MSAPANKRRDLLEAAIAAGDNGRPGDFTAWKEQARTALRVALGPADEVLARFDKVRYSPGIYTERTPDHVFREAREGGVRRSIAILQGALTEIEASEPSVPLVNVGGLHPWVGGIAAPFWEAGQHRTAVDEAARAIEVHLKAKLGRADGTGAPLVTSAFSPKPPTAGSQRLRFVQFDEGTDNWTSAHEGAMSFGRGCMMRVRNLYSHGHEPSEDEALEALAALSLLARWIDEATVVTIE